MKVLAQRILHLHVTCTVYKACKNTEYLLVRFSRDSEKLPADETHCRNSTVVEKVSLLEGDYPLKPAKKNKVRMRITVTVLASVYDVIENLRVIGGKMR